MFEMFRRKINIMGDCIREANRRQSVQIMENTFKDSQSYRSVVMNGESYDARIISDSKTTVRGGNGNFVIQFRNGIYPPAGTYVQIPNVKEELETWLILYESDSTSFPKHIIKKCNHLIRWKNKTGDIIERWAVFSDNTRIQDGTSYSASNKVTLPYHSMSLILPCDEETINIRIDRRFIVDNSNVEDYPDAWRVTNRNLISKVFNEYSGVLELSLSHDQYNTITDNRELMIADYYKTAEDTVENPDEAGYDCIIKYNGSSDLKMGTPYKKYSMEFYKDGSLDDSIVGEWEVVLPDENKAFFTTEISNNELQIKCKYNISLIGSHIRLIAKCDEFNISTEMPVKVVSSI